MPLDAIHTQIDRHLHNIGQLTDIPFKERQLESHTTAISPGSRMLVPDLDELRDIVEDLLPCCPLHDRFVRLFGRPIPGYLDVRRHRHDLGCPFLHPAPGKRPVGRQIELETMLLTQIKNPVEILVEQRLSHGGGNDLLQPLGSTFFNHFPDYLKGHDALALLPTRCALHVTAPDGNHLSLPFLL